MRRFVDISVPLRAGIASDPPGRLPEIDYYDHKQTAAEVVSFFPGATVDDLPDREGWAIERVRITTHNGTHLDAPYHYASTTDGGKRAITIDEVPLEWCLQPAVKLDFRHLPDGYVVTSAARRDGPARWRSSTSRRMPSLTPNVDYPHGAAPKAWG